MQIRTITLEDYEKLYSFWNDNYFVSAMDSQDHYSEFLSKNPELSVLAIENQEILGTALGSYDGRRGYLQKVVTKQNLRQQGIGKQLVEEVLHRLRKIGALYIPITVDEENILFYEKCGFKRKSSVAMSIEF